jgi:hypothetical protein
MNVCLARVLQAGSREKITGRLTNAVRRRLGFDVASRKRSVLRGLQDIGARSVRNERIERARAPSALERIALRSLLARPDRRDLVRRRFRSRAHDVGRSPARQSACHGAFDSGARTGVRRRRSGRSLAVRCGCGTDRATGCRARRGPAIDPPRALRFCRRPSVRRWVALRGRMPGQRPPWRHCPRRHLHGPRSRVVRMRRQSGPVHDARTRMSPSRLLRLRGTLRDAGGARHHLQRS